jgi:opacity protein-like surface antigen
MMARVSSCALAAMLVALSGPVASAADLDSAIGLIVAGEVEKAAGVQIFDIPNAGPLSGGSDTVFWSGTSGKLSLPLGENLSIQTDVDVEYNDQAFSSGPDEAGLRFGFQGAGHLSWRDPSQSLFGVFGGAGGVHYAFSNNNIAHNIRFVGGEAQFYAGDLTFYGQGGYIDVAPARPAVNQRLDDGFFARGVVRWFLEPDTRVQLEGGYAGLERVGGGGQGPGPRDLDIYTWGARYDTRLALPVIGDSALFIGYRGTMRENCFQFGGGSDLTDHTVMVGFNYQFGGSSMLDNDRRGATLDTPDFVNMLTCGGPGGRG